MKKIYSLIFSIFVLTLAMSPAMQFFDNIAIEDCCSMNCDSEENHSKSDNNCENVCNPFFTCNCSCGKTFTLKLTQKQYLTSNISYSKIYEATQDIISIPKSIWQPPKLNC